MSRASAPESAAPSALPGLPNGARLVLAPLCGITTSVFRKICFDRGAEMAVTEMISSEAVSRGKHKKIRAIKGLNVNEGPLSIQIFGSDPGIMSTTAAWLSEYEPEYVDINFGCPVKKVVKKNAGSAILKDPRLLGAICRAVVRASKRPVSAKVRAGWGGPDDVNIRDIARTVEDSGISMLAVHARTRKQNYSDKADWELIARAKAAVSIPVVGNGDVKTPDDLVAMSEITGCDAVMIGRAVVGNPWLFGEMRARLDGTLYQPPSARERIQTLIEHVRESVALNGEPLGVINTRKLTAAYLKRVPDARRLRGELMQALSLAEVEDLLGAFCVENGF